ncbi:FecR family protein, partial [Rubrivirga marina]
MPSDLPPELRAALDAEPDGDDLARVWDALAAAAPAVPTADWPALRARIAPGARRAADRPTARPGRTLRRLGWGTAALAALGVLALVWWARPVLHEAPAGELLAVTLPDGSAVTLNGGATLRHPRRFGDERGVALAGEAFFEVEPGSVPFVVSTHNARVEVLGTAFNVRAWAEDAATAVALVHGRVRVDRTGSGESRRLEPGEAVVVDAGGIEAHATDVGRAAAWRGGALAFDDLPLSAVLREVARRYGVAFDATGTPRDAHVSAFYAERPRLDALLGDLGAAAGVRFVPGADGYRVRA